MEWYVNNHGNPTTPAMVSRGEPILDFTNPGLQRFWVTHFIAPYLRQGFDGIGWNSTLIYAPDGAAGHFSERGRFIRQYSGRGRDPLWDRAQIRALGQFLRLARALDPPTRFAAYATVDCRYAPMGVWRSLLPYVDTIVDWEGYSNGGASGPNYLPNTPGFYCGNQWLFKTDFYIRIQKAGEHLVLMNLQPYVVRPFMTDTDPRARASLEWALANYLLVKYSHTYFWFGNMSEYGSPIVEQREELADLGRPIGDMRLYQHVYLRRYTNGMALVNPNNTAPLTVTLRKGVYTDLYGQRVNRVTMAPHSGLVLMTLKSFDQGVVKH